MRWYFLSLFCKVAFCQPFLSLYEYESTAGNAAHFIAIRRYCIIYWLGQCWWHIISELVGSSFCGSFQLCYLICTWSMIPACVFSSTEWEDDEHHVFSERRQKSESRPWQQEWAREKFLSRWSYVIFLCSYLGLFLTYLWYCSAVS